MTLFNNRKYHDMRTNYSLNLNLNQGSINCYHQNFTSNACLIPPDLTLSIMCIFSFVSPENWRLDKNLIISWHKEPKCSGLSQFLFIEPWIKSSRTMKKQTWSLYIFYFDNNLRKIFVLSLTRSYHQSLFIDIINFIIEFIILYQKRKLILFKGKQLF